MKIYNNLNLDYLMQQSIYRKFFLDVKFVLRMLYNPNDSIDRTLLVSITGILQQVEPL